MISGTSINQVRAVSTSEVIGNFIDLKKSGSNYIASCPFHDENTPSFVVNDTKGRYRCFGCNVSGDAIDFVMKHKNVPFVEAIQTLARLTGIVLEYEEIIDKEEENEKRKLQENLTTAVSFAVEKYRDDLVLQFKENKNSKVYQYLESRNISLEDVVEWQLGWAGIDWKYITPLLIQKGLFTAAIRTGICKVPKDSKGVEEQNAFDGYRSRITFPIADSYGRITGLGGRWYPMLESEKELDTIPKYINSSENEIYCKGNLLYGLDRAARAIKKKKFAFIVEGYFDVITAHKYGDCNTVGACGTALTNQQATLISRYTDTVISLCDGDAAGRKATEKNFQTLLKLGLRVIVGLLPDNEDPHSYIIGLNPELESEPLNNAYNISTLTNSKVPSSTIIFDHGINWYIEVLVADALNDPYKLGLVKEKFISLLLSIPNGNVRNNYLKSICKTYKWSAPEIQKQVNDHLTEKKSGDDLDIGTSNLPVWMDKESILNNGFCEVRDKKHFGYVSWNGNNIFQLTNFIMTPLFHIYAGKDSRLMILIDNGIKKAVVDMESKAMVNPDLLKNLVVCEGNFIVFGYKPQMLCIAKYLLPRFRRCIEVPFLGWQKSGFFTWWNKIYEPGKGIREIDEWGIVEHNNENYLVPAASAAFKHLQESDSDTFENQRALSYHLSSNTINFEKWCSLMHRVYKEKGTVSIAYVILTLFRDIVFSVDNNCLHLYFFGERTSGKTKTAESISALFYKERLPFNVNSGTDFAFFNHMRNFKNCPAVLDEVDIVKDEWFQVIKGIYDGEGRHRGVMGSKNRTEIMKVESTLILMSQFLLSKDDNSIVSRCIIEDFYVRDRDEEDIEAYNELKIAEKLGITSLIVEVLNYRSEFKSSYRDAFNENLAIWRRGTRSESEFNQRIMQNWCHLFTSYSILNKYLKLPVPTVDFNLYCLDKATFWCNFIRSNDKLTEFWNSFAFLINQGIVTEDWDYKIEELPSVKLRKGKREEYEERFNEPTKVLFLRLNDVHMHYQKEHRIRTGKEAMTRDNLIHYLTNSKSYLGSSKGKRFKRYVVREDEVKNSGTGQQYIESKKVVQETITTSYAFKYALLGLEIERINGI